MWFDELSGCLTPDEAVAWGILEKSDAEFCHKFGLTKVVLSPECLQDMYVRKQAMTVVRAGPVDPAEGMLWRATWDKLKNFNFDAAVDKYNVRFERDDNLMPYYDVDCAYLRGGT